MNQMIAHARTQIAEWIRGIGVRQVRLACGLVLFAYLVSHFLNHALGNISMDALAAGVYYHTVFWQFLPVAIVFYTAALLHTGLGIWALYQRRQFRWKAIEPLQLVLGLSIPALIIAHIIGVRLGQTLFGHEKLYPQELYSFWVAQPYKIWLMSRGAGHRLGPWQHRALFLAADESVLQARRAVPARRRGAGSDAGAARLLPGRTRDRRGSASDRNGLAREQSRARQVGTAAQQERWTRSPTIS